MVIRCRGCGYAVFGLVLFDRCFELLFCCLIDSDGVLVLLGLGLFWLVVSILVRFGVIFFD